ncbi:MAG: nuclear transport factor 2 family protein [Bryobacteraceae bacterium]
MEKGKHMNEQSNIQLVQRAYQNFKTGDIQSFLNLLAEDVVWQLPEMANVPFAGTRQGRGQVRQFFSKMAEVQDVVEFEPEEFIAQGDKVVVLGRFTMRVKATGRDAHSAWAHVWTLQGKMANSVREYVDTLAVSQAHNLALND